MMCRHAVLLAFVLTVFLSCPGVANAKQKKEKDVNFEKIPQHPGTGISVRDLNNLYAPSIQNVDA
jgi:hypothetical protein